MGQAATDEWNGLAERLIAQATEAQRRAYAPYSHYPVGAALLTRAGVVYTGVNVENAVFPLTTCAARTAVACAVSEGNTDFVALAVVTLDGGSPCGSWREVVRELKAGDLRIFIATPDGRYRQRRLADLWPDSFGPDNLSRPWQ